VLWIRREFCYLKIVCRDFCTFWPLFSYTLNHNTYFRRFSANPTSGPGNKNGSNGWWAKSNQIKLRFDSIMIWILWQANSSHLLDIGGPITHPDAKLRLSFSLNQRKLLMLVAPRRRWLVSGRFTAFRTRHFSHGASRRPAPGFSEWVGLLSLNGLRPTRHINMSFRRRVGFKTSQNPLRSAQSLLTLLVNTN